MKHTEDPGLHDPDQNGGRTYDDLQEQHKTGALAGLVFIGALALCGALWLLDKLYPFLTNLSK